MSTEPAPPASRDEYLTTLNRVAKWRKIFASWQLGTRANADSEAKAVKDHREGSIILRVEANALTRLLIEKGVFSEAEWVNTVTDEAKEYEKILEERFPGVKANDAGLDFDLEKAQAWMKDFPL
jgi:hypothetical protein